MYLQKYEEDFTTTLPNWSNAGAERGFSRVSNPYMLLTITYRNWGTGKVKNMDRELTLFLMQPLNPNHDRELSYCGQVCVPNH